MTFAIRTYGCVTLAVYLWACLATRHATLHNLGVSLEVAMPLALVLLLPLSLVRRSSRRAGGRGGGGPLDRELFRFPSGDPFRLRHLMTSVCVWGVIGSGKSSSRVTKDTPKNFSSFVELKDKSSNRVISDEIELRYSGGNRLSSELYVGPPRSIRVKTDVEQQIDDVNRDTDTDSERNLVTRSARTMDRL